MFLKRVQKKSVQKEKLTKGDLVATNELPFEFETIVSLEINVTISMLASHITPYKSRYDSFN